MSRFLMGGSGDYVHVDVSDQFSTFGKWSVAAVFLAVLVGLRVCSATRNKAAAIVSLMGAMTMIVWRVVLLQLGEGPIFYVRRGLVVEPLLIVFGNLVICYIARSKIMTSNTTVVDDLSLHSCSSRSSRFARCMVMMMWALCITVAMGDYSAVYLLSQLAAGESSLKLALLAGITVGSTLSLTGSISTVLAIVIAYDNVGYGEFLRDKALPSVLTLLIYAVALRFYVWKVTEDDDKDTGDNNDTVATTEYDGLALEEQDHNEESEHREDDPGINVDQSSDGRTEEPPQEALRNVRGTQVSLYGFAGYLFVITVFYVLGDDEVTVTLCSASLWLAGYMYVTNRGANAAAASTDGNSVLSPLSQDSTIGLILNIAGQLVLTSSLNDTGLPQALFNVTLGVCAEQMTSFDCLGKFAAVVCLYCILFSSSNTVLMMTATFPYAAPYDWMQVTLITSLVTNLAWSSSSSSPMNVRKHWKFVLPTTLLSLWVSIPLLSYFHWTPECSVKLGEC